MLDWLTGRKAQNQPLQRQNIDLNRSAVEHALASVEMHVPPQTDATQFCVKAAANVARAIAERARFSIDDLDDEGKLVTTLFSLAAGEQLSNSLNAPFDVVFSVVPGDLFGPEYARRLLYLERTYLRLSQASGILPAIKDNIREWIVAPSDQRLDRLAALFVVCRRYV
jgi:hypothetical protein